MPTINNSLGTVTNGVTTGVISQENKTFYDRTLLKRLVASLVFDKFAQKKSISKHGGNTTNFRRFNSLAAPSTPLTEGVTPTGNNISVTALTATVKQYGDYVIITDLLDLMGIDPVITETSEVMGEQAAECIDNVIRDEIFAGTSDELGGTATDRFEITNVMKLTGNIVKRAVRTLRNNKVKPGKGGYYIAFIDPYCAFDLMSDTLWQDVSKYNGGEQIMKGELGKIHGVKFIDNTNAVTYNGADLIDAARTLTVASIAAKVITVDEAISSAEATALAGRKILIDGDQYTIASATAGAAGAATVTISETAGLGIADGDVIYPGEGGAGGIELHATLLVGQDAYGIVDVEGSSKPEVIIKPKGYGDDPLNQRSSVGWKVLFTAKRLQELAMVRIETAVTE